MKFVTGCASVIGSNLADRLLSLGNEVVGVDNFSTGRRRFLAGALAHPKFRLVEADLIDLPALTGGRQVFHLAANADVRFGTARVQGRFGCGCEEDPVPRHGEPDGSVAG